MKVLYFALIFTITIVVSSCNKESNLQANATITGVDLRLCALCGGFFIKMDKSGTVYRTLSFPDYFKCKAEEMPLRVYVTYEMAGTMPDLINIVFIKRM